MFLIAFSVCMCQICRRINVDAMIKEKFEMLCSGIMKTLPDCEPELAFRLMCLSYGIRRKDAENLFYEKFGLSGKEVVEAFQKGILHN